MADKDTSSKPVPLREGYEHAKPPIPMKPAGERPFTGGYVPPAPPNPPPPAKQSDSGGGEKK
ncbi:MAG: hypothetical protein MUC56_15525 [Thermoanaerobaculales bacterium]|jgi:hypothetical protein|nr:hypothetical protein [Thermoanaerobaculales bacterium]